MTQIVEVVITRQTKPITEKSFGIPMLFTTDTPLDTSFTVSTSRSYEGSEDGLISVADDFGSSSETYKAAQALLSQDNKVSEFRIFVRSAVVQQIKTVAFSGPVITGQTIKGTVNGIALTDTPFDTDSATTLGNLRTKLAAVEGVSSAILTSNSIAVTAVAEWDLSLTSFSIVNPGSVTVTINNTTAGHTQGDDVATAIAEGKDWYEMNSTSPNKGAVIASAKAIEGFLRMALFLTSDSDCKTTVTTDVMSKLKAASFNRTAILWHQDTSEHADSAWSGRCLPIKPGKGITAFKTLNGITATPASALSSSEKSNILAKNGNVYTEVMGKNITDAGRAASGDFRDIIRDIDYMHSQITLRVFNFITSNEKVAFTDEGIQSVVSIVKTALNDMYDQGIIKDDYVVTSKSAASIPVNSRANRVLPDLNFAANLQGAIQSTQINGLIKV